MVLDLGDDAGWTDGIVICRYLLFVQYVYSFFLNDNQFNTYNASLIVDDLLYPFDRKCNSCISSSVNEIIIRFFIDIFYKYQSATVVKLFMENLYFFVTWKLKSM